MDENQLPSGNRIETPPVASRGRMNKVMYVMVGPNHDVEWVYDHNNLGTAVVGYNLVPRGSKPQPDQIDDALSTLRKPEE